MGSNWDSEAGLGLIIDIHATGRIFVDKLGSGNSLDIANSIRPGDEILEVDSLPISGKKTSELRKLMRGPPGSRVMLTLLRGGVRVLVSVTRVLDTDGTPHGFGKENQPSESSALRHGFTEAELVKAKSDLEKKLQQELRAAHEERAQRLEEDMVKARQQHMQNLQNDMENWRGQHIEKLQESMREVRGELESKLNKSVGEARERYRKKLEEELERYRQEAASRVDAKVAKDRSELQDATDEALSTLRNDNALKLQQQIGAERERLKQRLQDTRDEYQQKYGHSVKAAASISATSTAKSSENMQLL